MIGNLSLTLALAVSIYSLFASAFGSSRDDLASRGRSSAHLVTLLLSVASLMLIFLFLSDAFEFKYVAEYSSRNLPFIYKLTG